MKNNKVISKINSEEVTVLLQEISKEMGRKIYEKNFCWARNKRVIEWHWIGKNARSAEVVDLDGSQIDMWKLSWHNKSST